MRATKDADANAPKPVREASERRCPSTINSSMVRLALASPSSSAGMSGGSVSEAAPTLAGQAGTPFEAVRGSRPAARRGRMQSAANARRGRSLRAALRFPAKRTMSKRNTDVEESIGESDNESGEGGHPEWIDVSDLKKAEQDLEAFQVNGELSLVDMDADERYIVSDTWEDVREVR